jgi:hypothetical protein
LENVTEKIVHAINKMPTALLSFINIFIAWIIFIFYFELFQRYAIFIVSSFTLRLQNISIKRLSGKRFPMFSMKFEGCKNEKQIGAGSYLIFFRELQKNFKKGQRSNCKFW